MIPPARSRVNALCVQRMFPLNGLRCTSYGRGPSGKREPSPGIKRPRCETLPGSRGRREQLRHETTPSSQYAYAGMESLLQFFFRKPYRQTGESGNAMCFWVKKKGLTDVGFGLKWLLARRAGQVTVNAEEPGRDKATRKVKQKPCQRDMQQERDSMLLSWRDKSAGGFLRVVLLIPCETAKRRGHV